MSIYLRLLIFWQKVLSRAKRLSGLNKTVYVQERVEFFRGIWERAAEDLGYEFETMSSTIWGVWSGGKPVARISNFVISLDDPVTLDIAGDKLLTYDLLDNAGVRIPEHTSAKLENIDPVMQFMRNHQGPYVVKPARNTASGLGVTTHIESFSQCVNAVALAFLYGDEVLIERQVAGECYRLLYLGYEFLCASRRTGLRVVGDGLSTIEELVIRSVEPKFNIRKRDLRRDKDIEFTLARLGRGLATVPRAGEVLLVRSSPISNVDSREVRTVYNEDVTAQVCEEIREIGQIAVRAIGSEFCGVDIITIDPAVSLEKGSGVVSEVNTTPGLHHHYELGGSGGQPLVAKVLQYAAMKATRTQVDSWGAQHPRAAHPG